MPAPQTSVLLDGLDQPHGLAFDGVDSVCRRKRPGRRVRLRRRRGRRPPDRGAGGLPDARSPELGGAYAHALKSVAVGPDGAVYFSIGSTGNISAEDRDGRPAARDDHAGPARRRAGPTVRHRRPQRNRPGRRARRLGVDRGQQPRQLAVPTRAVVREGDPTMSTTTRRSRSPGSRPAANWVGPTAIPTVGRPTCRSCATSRPTPTAASSTARALPPVEQSLGAHSAPLGLSFVDRRAPRAVRAGRPGRRARVVESAAAARAGGLVLPLARRHSGRPADAGRRIPGRRRLALGSAGGRRSRPDGAVYITDDYAGAIYRLAPPGR